MVSPKSELKITLLTFVSKHQGHGEQPKFATNLAFDGRIVLFQAINEH